MTDNLSPASNTSLVKQAPGRRTRRKDNVAPLLDKSVKSKAKTPEWLRDFRYGRSLSIEFFKRNAWLLCLIIVILLSLMGLRYKTKTKMEQINSLKEECARAQSEMLWQKSEYMSLIRETEMQRLVDEKGLGLRFQEQPPYQVTAVAPADSGTPTQENDNQSL